MNFQFRYFAHYYGPSSDHLIGTFIYLPIFLNLWNISFILNLHSFNISLSYDWHFQHLFSSLYSAEGYVACVEGFH